MALNGESFCQLDKLLNAAGMYTAFLAEQLARMGGGNAARERPSPAAAPAAVVGSKRRRSQTQTQASPSEQVSMHPLVGRFAILELPKVHRYHSSSNFLTWSSADVHGLRADMGWCWW